MASCQNRWTDLGCCCLSTWWGNRYWSPESVLFRWSPSSSPGCQYPCCWTVGRVRARARVHGRRQRSCYDAAGVSTPKRPSVAEMRLLDQVGSWEELRRWVQHLSRRQRRSRSQRSLGSWLECFQPCCPLIPVRLLDSHSRERCSPGSEQVV